MTRPRSSRAGGYPSASQIRLFAFDLDDTLAPSRGPVPAEIIRPLLRLLDRAHVCVLSGADEAQFRRCLLERLPWHAKLENLHLGALYGAARGRFIGNAWQFGFERKLSDDVRCRAIGHIEATARRLNLWLDDDLVRGLRIHDRIAQITFSALGQDASVSAKLAWDPDGIKRRGLIDGLVPDLAECDVRLGGSTSVDVLVKGTDKGWALRNVMNTVGVGPVETLFVGDRLYLGGNDHPVVRTGAATYAVQNWNDTHGYLSWLVGDLGLTTS